MIRQSTPSDPGLSLRPPPPPAPIVAPPVERPITPPRVEVEVEVSDPVAVIDAPIPTRDGERPVNGALWSPPVPTFTYLAGPAGSGKTFATREWAERDKGILLCATTGIAAINLGGETINSVLGYFDTASLHEAYLTGFLTARLGKLWKSGVRRLILDEVSMLAGDQLTYLAKAIEEVNGRGYVLGKWQEEEDGGPPPAMGLTLVGDFLQLSPVKATFAFDSPEWDRFAPYVLTLTEIRRQDDAEFIEVLRAARSGHGTRVADYFVSRNAIQQETDDHYDGPTIVAKNDSVNRYNYLRLSRLAGTAVTFVSNRWGKLRSEWGTLDKPPLTWGIPQELQLKIGALVMILANERDEWRRLIYVNGDLGTLVDATETTAWVELQRTGETVEVVPVTRTVRLPIDSARRTELRNAGRQDFIDGKWEIAGSITYCPLRVAYAATVHKSQGLSLDKVQVNIRDPFFRAPGMLYVALSRARTAAGLRLVGSPKTLIERCVTDPRLRAWL